MDETMSIKEFTQTLNNRTIPLHEMKPVVLGLYCYRQMSDKLEYYMNKVLLKREYAEELNDGTLWRVLTPDEKEENIEIDDNIRMEFREINQTRYANEYPKIKIFADNYLHYFIEPEYLFSELAFKVTRGQDVYNDLVKALENISEVLIEITLLSNAAEDENESPDKLNIFQNINLKIFEDERDILNNLILNLSKLDFNMEDNTKLIANYEYLNVFFANSIKRFENIPTVPSISKLMAKLVAPKVEKDIHVYDPTFGIGSTFIEILKETRNPSENILPTLSTFNAYTVLHDELFVKANEINQSTYNEAIMNMIIHNVPYYDFDITNTDTIDHPKEHKQNFTIITADLPLGLKYTGDIKKLEEDPRFNEYKLSKRSTDFLFILDMIYHVTSNGIIVTTISPQTLFTEGPEKNIRKQLIENNYIDAIIKLPSLYNKISIEPIILIMKIERNTTDIMFIDASREYIKNGRTTELSQENIEKITKIYYERKELEKYSHVASIEEVMANNYNLTTKMYVNTYEKMNINIEEINKDFETIRQEIKTNDEQLKEYFKDKENIFGL